MMLTPELAAELMSEGVHAVIVLTLVFILPGLIAGVVISLFQAMTQINEQTLSFLPKLLVTLVVVLLAGRWATGYLMDFCVQVFHRAVQLAS